jgi:hypothetical protein
MAWFFLLTNYIQILYIHLYTAYVYIDKYPNIHQRRAVCTQTSRSPHRAHGRFTVLLSYNFLCDIQRYNGSYRNQKPSFDPLGVGHGVGSCYVCVLAVEPILG